MKTTFINACKYKFNRLLPLVLLMHLCFSASIYAQEFRLSTNISAGPAFHISMKADGYESLNYAFNYGSHLTLSVFEGKFLSYGLALGTYSKNYQKTTSFYSINYPDYKLEHNSGIQKHQLFYYGISVSTSKDISIKEKITIKTGIGIACSFIPFENRASYYDINRNTLLYNYLAFSETNISYLLNDRMSVGLNLFVYKECFKRYFTSIAYPFSNKKVYYGLYYRDLPEFPIFSISPQLSVKYVLK